MYAGMCMPRCMNGGQRIIFWTLVSPSTMGAGDQTQATKFATHSKPFTHAAISMAFNVLLSFFILKNFYAYVCVCVSSHAPHVCVPTEARRGAGFSGGCEPVPHVGEGLGTRTHDLCKNSKCSSVFHYGAISPTLVF